MIQCTGIAVKTCTGCGKNLCDRHAKTHEHKNALTMLSADKQLLDRWKQITDPREALREIVAQETFLGYDPYYKDLREGLLAMAERIGGNGLK